MQRTLRSLFVMTTVLIHTLPVSAAETSAHLTCKDVGTNTHIRCILEKPAILGGLDETMEASWNVRYSFPCNGHQTGLYFNTGTKLVGLRYTNPNTPQIEFTEDGDGPLTFEDKAPSDTRNATLVGECSLKILSVRISPSVRTLGSWTDSAKNQAKIIGLTLNLFELSSDFESYADWDTQQTATMLNAVRLKIRLFEPTCESGDQTACRAAAHFRVVVGALEAKIKGSPLPPIDNAAGESLAEVYEKDLQNEVKVGNDMIARFKRWQVVVTKELEDVIKQIQQ